MPELTYPLERAEAFARQARARAGDAAPPSLAAFETLIARYRSLRGRRSTARGATQRGEDAAADARGAARARSRTPGAAVEDALRAESR